MPKYEFRATNGAICCASDNPAYLCDACRRRLYADSADKRLVAGIRAMATAPPPPPDLNARIRAAYGPARPAVPRVASASGTGAPPPPDMNAYIRALRALPGGRA